MAGAALLALPHHPGYQEWRCRGQSLSELEALSRRLPSDSPVVLYHLGRALHQAGRGAQAVSVLRRAAQNGGDNARTVDALAQAQLAAGQTRETFDLLRGFVERHPDLPDGYQMLGRFLLGVQTYSRAVVVLEEATRRFPGDGENWKLLANARHQFRDIRGARAAVIRATTLAPTDPESWLLQARISRDQQMAADAHAAYEKAMRLSPSDVDLRAEFADYLARTASSPQDHIFASDLARRVLEQRPQNVRAAAALGLVLAQREQWDPAIPWLLQAARQNPGDVRLLRTLSRVYRRQGNAAEATRWEQKTRRAQFYRDAERRLLETLEVRPGDKAALLQMARLTGTHGDAVRSLRYHAIARNLPPDAAAPLLAAARDLHAGGFSGAAEQFAQRALQSSHTPREQEAARSFLSALR